MNLTGGAIAHPIHTDKDKKDFIFGSEQKLDLLGMWFIRKGQTLSKLESFWRLAVENWLSLY